MSDHPTTSTTAADPSSWTRYKPGDTVLEFGAIVVAVDPSGRGRLTQTEGLKAGDVFCCLPPLDRKHVS